MKKIFLIIIFSFYSVNSYSQTYQPFSGPCHYEQGTTCSVYLSQCNSFSGATNCTIEDYDPPNYGQVFYTSESCPSGQTFQTNGQCGTTPPPPNGCPAPNIYFHGGTCNILPPILPPSGSPPGTPPNPCVPTMVTNPNGSSYLNCSSPAPTGPNPTPVPNTGPAATSTTTNTPHPTGATTTTTNTTTNNNTNTTTTTTVQNVTNTTNNTQTNITTTTIKDSEGNTIGSTVTSSTSPLEEGEGSSVSGGTDCLVPPVCSGDAIQCAQLYQLHKVRCEEGSGSIGSLTECLNFSCDGDPIQCERARLENENYCALAQYSDLTAETVFSDAGLTDVETMGEGSFWNTNNVTNIDDEVTGMMSGIAASGGGNTSACPAPVNVSFGSLGSVSVSYEGICGLASLTRPLVIFFAIFYAGYGLVSVMRNT